MNVIKEKPECIFVKLMLMATLAHIYEVLGSLCIPCAFEPFINGASGTLKVVIDFKVFEHVKVFKADALLWPYLSYQYICSKLG